MVYLAYLYPVLSSQVYLPSDDGNHALGVTIPGESTLLITSHFLQPNKPYSGFALFVYPPKFAMPSSPMRLRICDADENCSISYLRGEAGGVGGIRIAPDGTTIDLKDCILEGSLPQVP